MYLRKTIYQMSQRLKSMIGVFHKAQVENLVSMIVGMVYSRQVSLPRIAEAAPMKKIQLESRVERFERLLACEKYVPWEVLKPIATRILRSLGRKQGYLMLLMDRSMINDTLNLLHIAVAFEGRALPLGWVRVPHEGNSNLELQQQLLLAMKDCLPKGVETFIVADREFHSIHLAAWVELEMGWHFVLRIKAGTWINHQQQWHKAGSLVRKGERAIYRNVQVTKAAKANHIVHLAAIWGNDEDEPWLLISDVADIKLINMIYQERFWIEEMFSDQKSRGLNLESSRITNPDRLERLLAAVAIAYLWIMEVGALVVKKGLWRQLDNRGAHRSVSLCQIGLRWLTHLFYQGFAARLFTGRFFPLIDT